MTAGLVEAQAPILIDPTTGQYLGNLSANKFDPNSVNNKFGQFGSPFSPTSINNRFNQWGSPYSPSSVRNPYAPVTQPVYQPSLPAAPSIADTLLGQIGTKRQTDNDDQFEQLLLMGAMMNSAQQQQLPAPPPPLPPMPLLDFSKAPATREEFDGLPAWKRATFEAGWNGTQFTQETLQRFVIEQMAKEIDQLRAAAKPQAKATKADQYADFYALPLYVQRAQVWAKQVWIASNPDESKRVGPTQAQYEKKLAEEKKAFDKRQKKSAGKSGFEKSP